MGIFDFFKKNKEPENKNEEIRILERPDFTKIDVKNLKDYYSWRLNYGKRKVNLDLNFETDSINEFELNQITDFINKIPEFDNVNRNYIELDFEQDVSETSDYLKFYLDEFDENELGRIINLKNRRKTRDRLLMEQLHLMRVGVYPQTPHFAIFDYSIDIDGEPSNQLLVVSIDRGGVLVDITWES